MKSKLSILAGVVAATALAATAAQAAPPGFLVKTVGNPEILSSTSHCPGGITRMHLGVKGTRVLLAGPDVVYVPFFSGKGTATLCALSLRHTTAAGQTVTTTGTLAI